MIPSHAKTKIELVVEESLLPAVLELLAREGAPGYTVVPASAGSGRGGFWEEHDLSGAERKRLVIVVVAREAGERLVEALHRLLAPYSGIVYTSEVRVVRGEHF